MKMKDIVIVGSGGLGREVKWLIDECNREQKRWNFLGWISNEEPGTVIAGYPILGTEEWILQRKKEIDVAIAIGNGPRRNRVVSYLGDKDFISYPVIISPSAEMSDSVVLGRGSIITAKSILTVDIKAGEFFFCNLACTVGHDCVIGDYVTLNPGVNLSGNVELGDFVTIGTGAAVIQGLFIGEHTIVGAGASVIRDIEANVTAVGVPARPITKKNSGSSRTE